MAKIEFHFEGSSTDLDPNGYGCKMIISGNVDNIGILLADYVIDQARKRNFEGLRILLVAGERLREKGPDQGRIIQGGFSKT